MAYGGLKKKMTPPRNSGGILQVSTKLSLSMEMRRLTRDGTVEPVSLDQILRRFLVQLTLCKIGNLTQSIHTLIYVMTIAEYGSTR